MHTIGLTLVFAATPGNTILCGLLWKRGLWRAHPGFAAWLAFSTLRTIAIAPFLLSGDARGYNTMFWGTEPLAIALLWWAVGETCDAKWKGLALGVGAAWLMLVQRLWSLRMLTLALGSSPAFVESALRVIALDRWFALGAAALAFSAWIRRHSPLAAGLVLASAVGALAMRNPAVTPDWLRFAGTAAWLAAQFIWLRWVAGEGSVRPAAIGAVRQRTQTDSSASKRTISTLPTLEELEQLGITGARYYAELRRVDRTNQSQRRGRGLFRRPYALELSAIEALDNLKSQGKQGCS